MHWTSLMQTDAELGCVRCSLRSTLTQILEALQPLEKLLELLNPRYDSVLRHTFEQARLSRQTAPAGTAISVSAARVGSALGSTGGYLNAAGTAGNLLLSSNSRKETGESLKSMPGLSKGLRRARDEHGGLSTHACSWLCLADFQAVRLALRRQGSWCIDECITSCVCVVTRAGILTAPCGC